jgi:hypothetical protein
MTDSSVKRFLMSNRCWLSQKALCLESNGAIEVANVVSLMYAQDPRLPWQAFACG